MNNYELTKIEEFRKAVIFKLKNKKDTEKLVNKAITDLIDYASGKGSANQFIWANDFLTKTLFVPLVPVPSVNYLPPIFYSITPIGKLITKCYERYNNPV